MPSAYCLVDGFPTNLVSVQANQGDTVTISLNDRTGVNSWSIICFGSDQDQSPTDITNSLTIDSVNKTASFTMPSNPKGCKLLFQSIINNGIDNNGTSQSSFVYTFGTYSLGAANLEKMAGGETTEGDRTYGWSKLINKLIDALS